MSEDSEYPMSWLCSSAVALVAAIFSVSHGDVSFGMGVCSTCLVGLSLGSWQYTRQFCLSFIMLSLILFSGRQFRLFRYRIHSLYILFRGRRKQNPTAPIWRLPPELLQYIIESLPPSTAAAFALTSKAIMNVFGQQCLKKLEGRERLALLEHLQSDLPNHLLCYQCSVFHTKASMNHDEHQSCFQKNGYVVLALGVLLFTEAQQAMNNHLYGARHPVGPNQLKRQCQNYGGGIQLWEHSELRASGAIMLLEQQITLILKWKKAGFSKRNAGDRPITLCPHLRCSELLNTQYKIWTSFKCPVCGTEVAAYRRARWVKHDEELTLYIWRLLGPCRNPFESQWRLLTNYSIRPTNHSTQRRHPSLQAQWETAQRLPEPSAFSRRFSTQFRRPVRYL